MKYDKDVAISQTVKAHLEHHHVLFSKYSDCVSVLAKANEFEVYSDSNISHRMCHSEYCSQPVDFYMKRDFCVYFTDKKPKRLSMLLKVLPSFYAVGLIIIYFSSPYISDSWVETTIVVSGVFYGTKNFQNPPSNIEVHNTHLDTHFFWDAVSDKMKKMDSVLFQGHVELLNKSVQTLEVYASNNKLKIHLMVKLRLQAFISGYEFSLHSTNFIYALICSKLSEPFRGRNFYDNTCCEKSCFNAKVSLIRNRYEDFSHFLCCNFSILKSEIFQPRDAGQNKTNRNCFLLSKLFKYYLIKNSEFISWNSAHEKCQDTKGFLPRFHSQQDLDELLGIVKLSANFPILDAVYIGLFYNITNQVREKQNVQIYCDEKNTNSKFSIPERCKKVMYIIVGFGIYSCGTSLYYIPFSMKFHWALKTFIGCCQYDVCLTHFEIQIAMQVQYSVAPRIMIIMLLHTWYNLSVENVVQPHIHYVKCYNHNNGVNWTLFMFSAGPFVLCSLLLFNGFSNCHTHWCVWRMNVLPWAQCLQLFPQLISQSDKNSLTLSVLWSDESLSALIPDLHVLNSQTKSFLKSLSTSFFLDLFWAHFQDVYQNWIALGQPFQKHIHLHLLAADPFRVLRLYLISASVMVQMFLQVKICLKCIFHKRVCNAIHSNEPDLYFPCVFLPADYSKE